jgi:hypothetical protein
MNGCQRPDLGRLLETYSFDARGVANVEDLEAHLLVCDSCWAELQRLEAAVRLLREDAAFTQPTLAADGIQMSGFGGALERPFAGHRLFAVGFSVVFGLLVALALLVEVAYEWSAFDWARPAAAGAGLACGGGLLLALWWIGRAASSGRRRSLAVAFAILVAVVGAVGVAVAAALPARAIVRADFQTFMAYLGWLKDLGQASIVAALSLLAFHAVVGLQRELWRGQSRTVVQLLGRHPLAVWPRGTFFISPWVMTAVVAGLSIWFVLGVTYVLERLLPSPEMPLFMALNLARMALLLVAGVWIAVWYTRALNEIKREAIAVSSLREQTVVH